MHCILIIEYFVLICYIYNMKILTHKATSLYFLAIVFYLLTFSFAYYDFLNGEVLNAYGRMEFLIPPLTILIPSIYLSFNTLSRRGYKPFIESVILLVLIFLSFQLLEDLLPKILDWIFNVIGIQNKGDNPVIHF